MVSVSARSRDGSIGNYYVTITPTSNDQASICYRSCALDAIWFYYGNAVSTHS